MKTLTPFLVLVLLFSLSFSACDPRANEPFYLRNTPDCNEGRKLDSLNTLEFLQAEWEWEYILCPNDSAGGNDEEYKGLSVEFKSDFSVDLFIDGQINQSSTWGIIASGNGTWSLDIQPDILQLYGYLVICEDRVQFNNTPTDGCANYFKRSE